MISFTSPLMMIPLPDVSVSKKSVNPDVSRLGSDKIFTGFVSGAERPKVFELQSDQVIFAVVSGAREVCKEMFSGVGLSMIREFPSTVSNQ